MDKILLFLHCGFAAGYLYKRHYKLYSLHRRLLCRLQYIYVLVKMQECNRFLMVF